MCNQRNNKNKQKREKNNNFIIKKTSGTNTTEIRAPTLEMLTHCVERDCYGRSYEMVMKDATTAEMLVDPGYTRAVQKFKKALANVTADSLATAEKGPVLGLPHDYPSGCAIEGVIIRAEKITRITREEMVRDSIKELQPSNHDYPHLLLGAEVIHCAWTPFIESCLTLEARKTFGKHAIIVLKLSCYERARMVNGNTYWKALPPTHCYMWVFLVNTSMKLPPTHELKVIKAKQQ
jgi:hypothetical protein